MSEQDVSAYQMTKFVLHGSDGTPLGEPEILWDPTRTLPDVLFVSHRTFVRKQSGRKWIYVEASTCGITGVDFK